MGEREKGTRSELVERHLASLSRLAYAADFFDRTAAMDLKLVDVGCQDLADQLALLEERMGEVAESLEKKGAQPGGVGRILSAAPELRRELVDLLGRALPALGNPQPDALLGRVPVAAGLHLTPDHTRRLGWPRKGPGSGGEA